jgi:SOS-response transcriptional repressor LexA
MRDAGILDGDVVSVRPDSEVIEGAVAAVRMEDPTTGENLVTVKRIYREGRGLRFELANPAFQPIRVRSAEVVGPTRTY